MPEGIVKRIVFSSLLAISFCTSYSIQAKPAPSKLQFQVIQAEIDINADNVLSATLVKMADGHSAVSLVLNDQTANQIEQLTKKNIGKRAMIILGHKVISITTIQSTLGKRFEVAGFTEAEAKQAVGLLSGSANKVS